MKRTILVAAFFPALLALGGLAAGEPLGVVVCAPGYPGNTEQAQPTMDDLARSIERSAGWSEGRVDAVYHSTMDGGLDALAAERSGLALVPLPFYLEKKQELGLTPLVEVVQATGGEEVWSLVARKGAVKSPSDLAGWDIAGVPGYSASFVQNVALDGWGRLPADTRIQFAPRVLSVLRKAASGQQVAAVLDRAQTEALASLPFGADLEVVARSRPVIGSLVCRVGDRIDDALADDVARALVDLSGVEGSDALLDTMRVTGFRPLPDGQALADLERAFAASVGATP